MLSFIGGKSTIAPKLIIPNISKDIEVYVEGFGGMFWTFFKMNKNNYPNLKKIVYNDFNPLNYNLFQCIRTPGELLHAINDIPCQQKGVSETPPEYRDLFNTFQKELFADNVVIGDTDYESAAKYVYILTQVFSGSNPKSSGYIDLKGKYKSKYLTFRDKLMNDKWIEKFTSITDVENMDFEDVIRKYDSPTTYFYLDPPYYVVGEGNYYSNHEFGRYDHERLANILHNIDGKFSLSYYDFDLLHEWFPQDRYRWERMDFTKAAAAKKGVSQPKSTELLIMNY